MALCSLCTDEIKEKDTSKYTRICDCIGCATPVRHYYRFCKRCSKKYSICEVCGVRLK